MSNCVSCNSPPTACDCSSSQTCVQTPRNCTTCPQNICVNLSDSEYHHSSSIGLGGILGGTIGATTAIILILLSIWIIYKRNNHFLLSYLLPWNSKFNHKSNKKLQHSFNLKNSSTSINQKSVFARNPNHLLTSSKNSHHQSVIFLPTDESRDPKLSPLESDDDPFSDIHSGVSIISHRPNSNQHSPHLINDIDPISKATPTSSDRNSFLPPSHNATANATVALPVPPPPSGNPSNAFKPIRPYRAPGLDLRLPGNKAQIDSDLPSPSKPSNLSKLNDSPNNTLLKPATPTRLSSPKHSQNEFSTSNDQTQATIESNYSKESDQSPRSSYISLNPRPFSGMSDTASQDSHLSSILDPAMIVTPVTLVRTASGRQAAVQRVALRGQEKARVVRLPPSSTPKAHVPSPLSVETHHADFNTLLVDPETFPETFKFTPSINLALGSRLSWDPDSPHSQNLAESSISIDSSAMNHKPPTATTSIYTKSDQHQQPQRHHNNTVNKNNSEENPRRPNQQNNRLTAAYSTRSSVGSSSVCESFLMDEEEVEFPTVLRRSPAIMAAYHPSNNQSSSPTSLTTSFNPVLDHPTPVSHHHVNVKALGRDRAVSLSSIIGEEAAMDSLDSSLPPLPALPLGTNTMLSRNKSNHKLPEPFKPFAGQKPSRGSTSCNNNHHERISRSHSNRSGTRLEEERETEEGKTRTRNPEFTQSTFSTASLHSRMSTDSAATSGYGSVLEGIPFNIAFNSESDDMFNTNHSSSNLNLNFSFNLSGDHHTGSVSPTGGPHSIINSSNGSVGRMSEIDSSHFSLGGNTVTSNLFGGTTISNPIDDNDNDDNDDHKNDDTMEAAVTISKNNKHGLSTGSHQEQEEPLNTSRNIRTNSSNPTD